MRDVAVTGVQTCALPICPVNRAGTAGVHGTVTGADGTPVPDAPVRLLGWHPGGAEQELGRGQSDPAGRYTLRYPRSAETPARLAVRAGVPEVEVGLPCPVPRVARVDVTLTVSRPGRTEFEDVR